MPPEVHSIMISGDRNWNKCYLFCKYSFGLCCFVLIAPLFQLCCPCPESNFSVVFFFFSPPFTPPLKKKKRWAVCGILKSCDREGFSPALTKRIESAGQVFQLDLNHNLPFFFFKPQCNAVSSKVMYSVKWFHFCKKLCSESIIIIIIIDSRF